MRHACGTKTDEAAEGPSESLEQDARPSPKVPPGKLDEEPRELGALLAAKRQAAADSKPHRSSRSLAFRCFVHSYNRLNHQARSRSAA